jgi:C-lobe and N-lobe beta barrels of Tf-binding protein B
MYRLVLGSFIALSVAGCGGGGGTQSAGTTPPPVASEVARQTPINASLLTLTQAETFNTVAATVRLTDNNGTISNVTATQAGMSTDVTIAFNPTNQSYTVTTNRGGISNQTAFTAADLVSTPAGVAEYAKIAANGDDQQLILTNTGGLQYASLGTWLNIAETGNVRTVQAASFAFGQETAVSAVPKTGTASYNLVVAGIGRDGSTPYGIGGDGTATVNFAASSLTTVFNVSLFGANGPVASATVNGTASISSAFARFSGTLQGTVNGTNVTGPMNGAFFGPAAQEIGGSWRVSGGQLEAVGGFVGATVPGN